MTPANTSRRTPRRGSTRERAQRRRLRRRRRPLRASMRAAVGRPGRSGTNPLVMPRKLAASDSHLVAGVVERHEPALLGSKPFPRAQDSYRTDSESFTEPEDGQRSATIAAVLLRDTFGRFINRELKSVSPSQKRLALSGRSLPLLARDGFLSLEVFEPVFKRCPPGLRIGPQGLGKKQECCQFCAQGQLILAPRSRPNHTFVESAELPSQLFVLHPAPSWIVILRSGRMGAQGRVNHGGLAIDRCPQPGDLRDDVGFSVEPQGRIVSPYRTRVNVGRRKVTQ